MKSKTLKELRALAKARGFKGYSKLTKEQLLDRLSRDEGELRESAGEPAGETRVRASSDITATAPRRDAEPRRPPETKATIDDRTASAALPRDEVIESAKYAMRPNGRPIVHAEPDLNEDIDRLPVLREPAVCLLPQKPGILYAYWTLAPETLTAASDYKLRLGRGEYDSLQIYEEIPVSAPRGGWYFHVAEDASDASLLAQLGYYRDGRFIAAGGRSAARLPSLHASMRTDERWWIDEADFRRMYLRAGGEVTSARRYRWSASIGSPGAPPPSQEEHMAWPGAVSSRSK